MWIAFIIIVVLVVLVGLGALAYYDLTQKQHAILRNFPIIGHFRYWLEAVGPELRQYIVTDNNEERPFSRDQRRWVYASSKKQNNYFGFGTDNELEQSPNYLIIRHVAFPLHDCHEGEPGYDPSYRVPCAKIMGGHRKRDKAFRPESIVNISAMSYGSLSHAAIEALNRGCKTAGCLHNTGEGGVSKHHMHGGELIWQLGTGYFGCRDARGDFDLAKFKHVVEQNEIRAIEIKMSQGAKPGLGGVLPSVKITHELAEIRGIPMGQDCLSPSSHSAFSDEDSLLDFVEHLAAETGLPVGIKSAVGEIGFWQRMADLMLDGKRGVDFIAIDGGEGGTGAAPLVFSDHVAFPYKIGFTKVFAEFAKRKIDQNVVFIGSGRLGFPDAALFAIGLGADLINVAREAMMAIGCIQAQKCHTNHCPTGVATQNEWLVRGLDPTNKATRLANYILTLRKELLRLSRACGVVHPALIRHEHFNILNEQFGTMGIDELFGYEQNWGLPSDDQQRDISTIMQELVAMQVS
ncbi:MAG: FMN-binding glutamate synthase family protein [Planctomycetota bacterium]|nr:FMN-binding glutamate synthase family protein [Planctomycetota bacterium]